MIASVTTLEPIFLRRKAGWWGGRELTKMIAILGAMIFRQLNRSRCIYSKYIYIYDENQIYNRRSLEG